MDNKSRKKNSLSLKIIQVFIYDYQFFSFNELWIRLRDQHSATWWLLTALVVGSFPPTHCTTNDAVTGKKFARSLSATAISHFLGDRKGQWSSTDKENHFSAKVYLGCLSGCEKVHWFSQLKKWVASLFCIGSVR